MMQFGEMTEEKRDELTEIMAQKIEQLGLTAPAIFFLELNKPLSYIGSQALHFFSPIVGPLFSSYDEYAFFFEDRKNVERLIVRLEEVSLEQSMKAKAAREAAKKQGPSQKKSLLNRLLGR